MVPAISGYVIPTPACTGGINHEQPFARALRQNEDAPLSFILSICLSFPGVCQTAHLDQLEAMATEESSDPVERWRPLVATQFPESEVDTALCLIRHESGGDPSADNPRSSARGLFQVLGSLWAPHYGVSRAALYDPLTNTLIAHGIWEKQGWGAWSPYKRGLCHDE